MNRKILYGMAALIAGTTLHAQDQAAVQKEIEQARQVIESYVNTRQSIAKAQAEWKSYQELTNRRIELYEDEIAELEETIQAAEEETTSAERRIAGIREDIRVLRSATNIVSTNLPALEQKVRELYAYFPTPLKDKVTTIVQKMGSQGMQTSDRMALVIGVLNEVDKFNNGFTFQQEEIREDNQTKLVDVLYLGLAVGYYADKEGQIGGMLIPADKEWEWIEKNDLAPLIHQAMQYYSGDIKPAMMVELPVEIQNLTIGN